MTPQQALALRSDNDDDDLVEPSNVVIARNNGASKSVEDESNINQHDRTRTNSASLPDRQSTGNKATLAANRCMSSSSAQRHTGNKQRNRGRTRRHYSRQQASLLTGNPWEGEASNSLEVDASIRQQPRRRSARSSSTKRLEMDMRGMVNAMMTPVCERAASAPVVASTTNVSDTASGGQGSLNRMRSFQRKTPHELHREMVQKLTLKDDGSGRVFGQLSFGVTRLRSEEDALLTEDGAILSGGVCKKPSLAKRGSLEEHYEKGSLKDLERMRSKQSSGTFGSQSSAPEVEQNNVD